MCVIRSSFLVVLSLLATACSLSGYGSSAGSNQQESLGLNIDPKHPVEFQDESSLSEVAQLGLIAGQPITGLPAPRLEVTKEVEKELETYLARNGSFVRVALERRDSEYQIAKKIFSDEGLPPELLNLAVIESGYRATATSPMGAVGLWQFTKDTAKRYGLGNCKVSGDERTDTILSTLAAARHLKSLYGKFDDWYLALAGYNQGEYAVEKSIDRFDEHSFWKLARRGAFPAETARFVPKFIAVTIIDKLRDRYGNEDLRSKLASHLRVEDRLAKVFSDTVIG